MKISQKEKATRLDDCLVTFKGKLKRKNCYITKITCVRLTKIIA